MFLHATIRNAKTYKIVLWLFATTVVIGKLGVAESVLTLTKIMCTHAQESTAQGSVGKVWRKITETFDTRSSC